MKGTLPMTSATRPAAVVLGVNLSAQSRLTGIELASGETIRPRV